ncbi:MAG: dienelactone hydrolase family protein [Deltaproteobacteria bacterium]|nr:dienelactone hydrolase family protein [Deltaproteobacteria bacterium]
MILCVVLHALAGSACGDLRVVGLSDAAYHSGADAVVPADDDGADDGGAGGGGQDAQRTQPPGSFGPHHVGFRQMVLQDPAGGKSLTTAIWYPARKPSARATPATYLYVIPGRGYENLAPERSAAPYPLVLFSHGNFGINVQSISFTEHLASQGFVVAAPNHEGNTLGSNPSDEEMARISLERPVDIVATYEALLAMNDEPDNELFGLIDGESVGISGHSFGGYTALVLAGSEVNVDAARARCEAGVEGDVFCPYIIYFPAGQTVRRPAGAAGFKAALAMAPGGYAAFGDDGLARITMAVMLMGGTLDEYTLNDLRPLYNGLVPPKYKIEIDRAGHMSFTDICRADLDVKELNDLCDPARYIGIDRAFEIINPFAAAFMRFFLKGETEMAAYLAPGHAGGFPEVSFTSESR